MATSVKNDAETVAANALVTEMHNAQLNASLTMLSCQWGLGLELPPPNQSPSQRREKARQEKTGQVEVMCVSRIKALHFKNRLTTATTRFNEEAEIMWNRWVSQPRADRGLLSRVKTRHSIYPVTPEEKKELLDLLLRILEEEYAKYPSTPSFGRVMGNVNDSAIPSNPILKSDRQRSSGEHFEDVQTRATSSNMFMPPPPLLRSRRQEVAHETSFISDTSSVFTVPSLRNFDSNETQTTIPDEDFDLTQPNSRSPSPAFEHPQNSDYGCSSSFEQHIHDSFGGRNDIFGSVVEEPEDEIQCEGLNQYAQNIVDSNTSARLLYNRLKDVFPEFNSNLERIPFAALYELTRICIHTEVSLKSVKLKNISATVEYDTFWTQLKANPAFKDKSFPQQCSKEVWAAATSQYSSGSRAVVFSGSLSYNFSSEAVGPLFRFRLEPMRLDDSYRLGRRFGNDRYFELDFPQISGRKSNKDPVVPAFLLDLEEAGQVVLISWLIDDLHQLFGRIWKPFHAKLKDRRGRKLESRNDEEINQAYRIYFFATDGYGFEVNPSPLDEKLAHEKMSIFKMLNLARPIAGNAKQKFLKLFARTDLIVSRNTPTVVLNKSQIIHKDDIMCGDEVMTDGAGQISYQLALMITQKMGLSFVPSGFQARIGEAKGFWSVDYTDQSTDEWITVYASQCKWEPNLGLDTNHESHRTFEVLRFSSGLKAADLNLQFLPILQDRAIDTKEMNMVLKNLLEEGLQRKLLRLQDAMVDPQSFRVWLRESSSGIGERIKNERVPYRAGVPFSNEERLNLFLDAGFDPNKLYFLKDLSRKAFTLKCEDLEAKLNITVLKSTYAFMVPDFAQVLEPDEVYIDFSRFTDDSSGFSTSNVLLNGAEILVARSPAHYVSDIQKVKAIHKVQLMGLKDVIVFSTKGNPSLAAKLSGGDYDGDIAWVCWEPLIVKNFQNAPVLKAPDLVKEGLIAQSGVTYETLVKGEESPTSVFLNESFRFNLQQKMLGSCTVFKEYFCYDMGTVNSPEAVYLSTLLSYLVDQAKQGYSFTENAWVHFKSVLGIKQSVPIPGYKDTINANATHIIDRLKLAARATVKKLLTELHKNTVDPPKWDGDLIKYHDYAQSMAKNGNEWEVLLTNLKKDIQNLRTDWAKSAAGDDESKPAFMLRMDKFYETFTAIRPHVDNVLTQSLLRADLPNEDDSTWALLRASTLFATYRQQRNPTRFVWILAGKWLAALKAEQGGNGSAHRVCPQMYAMLRPDAAYVKKIRSQRDANTASWDENFSVVNADEIAEFEE